MKSHHHTSATRGEHKLFAARGGCVLLLFAALGWSVTDPRGGVVGSIQVLVLVTASLTALIGGIGLVTGAETKRSARAFAGWITILVATLFLSFNAWLLAALTIV